MKLTDEDAVKIAKWLHMHAVAEKDFQFPEQYRGVDWFKEWLLSAKGERAMMDKVDSVYEIHWCGPLATLRLTPLSSGAREIMPLKKIKVTVDHSLKTRAEALINAILKRLEDD